MRVRVTVMVMFVLFFGVVSPCEGQTAENPRTKILHFPQFADGGGYWSEIVITSSDTTAATKAELKFFLSSGATTAMSAITQPEDRRNVNGPSGIVVVDVPAGGSTVVKTQGRFLPEVKAGRLEVKGVGIDALLVFHYPYGSEEQETTVTPSPLRSEFKVPLDFQRAKGYTPVNTGIAFGNPNPNAINLTFTLVNADGVVVGSKTFQLPALGHLARFISENELFETVLAARADFRGTLRVASEGGQFAMMSVGFLMNPDGKFKMNNSPAQPPVLRSAAEIESRTVQAVCFIAADQATDGCEDGIRFVGNYAMSWMNLQFESAGRGQFSEVVDFVRDEAGRIKVEVFQGRYTAAEYDAERPQNYSLMRSELLERYGWVKKVWVGNRITMTNQFSLNAGNISIFAGPWQGAEWAKSQGFPSFFWFNNTWASFSEAYLANPDGLPQWSGQFSKYVDVLDQIDGGAREFAWLFLFARGFSHGLQEAYPGKWANITCRVCGDSREIWVAHMVNPNLKPHGLIFINSGLDKDEIDYIVRRYF